VFLDDRQYEPVDAADQISSRPDFAMLIYPGGLVHNGGRELHEYIKVTADVPPMFFVHAFDDRVSIHNSLSLAAELKDVGVPAELHVYSNGGHGYGLRETEVPVTHWAKRAEDWMRASGWLLPAREVAGSDQ
jgi:acetyl esterase/lipase